MIKIYQINIDKDVNKVKFMKYSWIKEFDFSIYDKIWSGEVFNEEENLYMFLDEIYEAFNLYHPKDFTGHSLSVSDIVQIIDKDESINGYYYCDSFGWLKLDEDLIK